MDYKETHISFLYDDLVKEYLRLNMRTFVLRPLSEVNTAEHSHIKILFLNLRLLSVQCLSCT